MASPEFGWFTLLLFLLIASAQVLGFLFTRLRQPKVVGEILAGVLLGPCEPLMGTANQWVPLLLVVSIAVAVTTEGRPLIWRSSC